MTARLGGATKFTVKAWTIVGLADDEEIQDVSFHGDFADGSFLDAILDNGSSADNLTITSFRFDVSMDALYLRETADPVPLPFAGSVREFIWDDQGRDMYIPYLEDPPANAGPDTEPVYKLFVGNPFEQLYALAVLPALPVYSMVVQD